MPRPLSPAQAAVYRAYRGPIEQAYIDLFQPGTDELRPEVAELLCQAITITVSNRTERP